MSTLSGFSRPALDRGQSGARTAGEMWRLDIDKSFPISRVGILYNLVLE